MPQNPQSDPSGFETLEAFSHAEAFNRWLFQKIRLWVQGQTLEIGSGIGNISAFLLRDHTNVSLSDLRPEYCQILKKKFEHNPHLRGIYELDLSILDFKLIHPELLEKFDTVIALNVVEHIKEDALAIQNAKSLLKKDGRLIILVPSGRRLYNSIDLELGHYKRYSKSKLNELMESAGLTVTDSRYFNAAAIVGWWFAGSILKEKIVTPAKLNLYNRLVPLFRFVDWFVAPFTGISVISVGIKNVN
jgi:2-polyprenyl-3-methyl-5-hydroxy-6-metoxy-1,4-benzoquinol methylase